QGMILGSDNQKMSKSKGNVIDPTIIINPHGADSLRVYEMFMGPLTDTKIWSDSSLDGTKRWLDRVWRIIKKYIDGEFSITSNNEDKNLESNYNILIREVTKNIKEYKFNIAISNMMVYINYLYKIETISSRKYLVDFLIMYSTFAPHMAEELLEQLNEKQVSNLTWPKFDDTKILMADINIVVQVNGKVRGNIKADDSIDENQLIKIAKEENNVAKFLLNKTIVKTIVVKNKIINFVIK
ncbi:MAG: class I tRNA ligase family protein, partial [Metamycoplasmataceae bacterium]